MRHLADSSAPKTSKGKAFIGHEFAVFGGHCGMAEMVGDLLRVYLATVTGLGDNVPQNSFTVACYQGDALRGRDIARRGYLDEKVHKDKENNAGHNECQQNNADPFEDTADNRFGASFFKGDLLFSLSFTSFTDLGFSSFGGFTSFSLALVLVRAAESVLTLVCAVDRTLRCAFGGLLRSAL